MPLNTGESTLQDLIAAKNLSFAQFGIPNIERILAYDQAAWNLQVSELMTELCEISTDQQRIYGASTDGVLTEVDELGRSNTQKPAQGSQVAFPLRHFQGNLGWTREWWKNHTPADLALAVMAVQKAHLRKIYGAFGQAIFAASDYSFVDYTKLGITFNIKRFLNADGAAIPDGPHGEVFNPNTHTHYTAMATLTAAAVNALGANVLEHKLSANVKIAFNANDIQAVQALTGFTGLVDPRITLQYGTGQVPTERLDITQLNDRLVGIMSPYAIWVKPWVPQGYAFAYDAQSAEKPLVMRVDPGTNGPDLQDVQKIDANPLHIEYKEAYFGIGAYCRTAGAALFFNTGGGTTWVDASITGY
jgi:hypothetical protein